MTAKTNRRAALGRGLSALIPDNILDNELPAEGATLQLIEIDRIKPNPEQPRSVFVEGALDQLADSIRAHGVLTPLLVRRDERGVGFILIAGERRLRASGMAGLDKVPVWIREETTAREQLELALVENIQREDLDPIETALAYRRLVEEFGLTQAEVARRIGKDRATVANSMRVLRLPEFALDALRDGRITVGHAKALLPLPDNKSLRNTLEEVIRRDLSVRATERMVQGLVGEKKRTRASHTSSYKHVSDMLTRSLGTRVQIQSKNGSASGRIVIEYFSKEELDRLVQWMWTQ